MRLAVKPFGAGLLNNFAQVHDRDPVRHVANDAEVVCNEQIRQTELVLKVLEQVDDLRLHRHIQR